MTLVNRRDPQWIDAFIERVHDELPNVSTLTLRALTREVWDDKELRGLAGRAAAEHWLKRSRSGLPTAGR